MFGTVNLSVSTRSLAITLAAFSFSLILGCTGEQSSGDCYYDRVDTMAEVTELRPKKDHPDQIEVILDFKASSLAFEDQEMGALKGVHIDQAFVDRNHIRIGNQYSVLVSEITKGDCTPLFVSFQHALE